MAADNPKAADKASKLKPLPRRDQAMLPGLAAAGGGVEEGEPGGGAVNGKGGGWDLGAASRENQRAGAAELDAAAAPLAQELPASLPREMLLNAGQAPVESPPCPVDAPLLQADAPQEGGSGSGGSALPDFKPLARVLSVVIRYGS